MNEEKEKKEEKEEKEEKEKKEKEKKEEIIEECVICHNKTQYLKSTPIDQREYYIVGCGQLCKNCGKIY